MTDHTVDTKPCWTRYDAESVIGDFGWLWQQTGDGEFGWTLICTVQDAYEHPVDSDLGTITLDDSNPPRRANRLAGAPYLPCPAPTVSQGEADRLEVTIRLPEGASISHAFGPGARTENIATALCAVLDPTTGDAAADMLAERRRQVTVEGWTAGHDDAHDDGVLARAGACYAMDALSDWHVGVPGEWPFAAEWWKPTTARRDLVKAAALILAEIERLDRAEAG